MPAFVHSTAQATPILTGAIDVRGPAGAGVQIGGNVYPPAPTRVELPPGDYVVWLRYGKGKKRHIVSYPAHVTAGRTTSIR